MKFVKLHDDVVVLWGNKEDHIPHAIHGLPWEVIDESSKTYTIKYAELLFEVRKIDTELIG